MYIAKYRKQMYIDNIVRICMMNINMIEGTSLDDNATGVFFYVILRIKLLRTIIIINRSICVSMLKYSPRFKMCKLFLHSH